MFVVAVIVLFVLNCAVRYCGRHYVSGDASSFLLPWFDDIKPQGLASLSHQVGDYNIVYQTLIALMTYVPINSLYSYKIVSIIFDFVLAIAAGLFVASLKGDQANFRLPAVVALVSVSIPTVWLNSAFWAQCDAIYTAFVVLCLFDLWNGRIRRSFCWLGVAFAFKLQAIFILPFLLVMYFCSRRFSIANLLYTLLVFYIMCLPGVIARRNVLAPFELYASQTGTYKWMAGSLPSFWFLFGANYQALHQASLVVTVALLVGILAVCMYFEADLAKPFEFVAVALWTTWVVLFFLPSMHERYGYLLTMLAVILSFVDWHALPLSVFFCTSDLLTYGHVLFGVPLTVAGYMVLSAVDLVFLAFFSFLLIRRLAAGYRTETVLPHNDSVTQSVGE